MPAAAATRSSDWVPSIPLVIARRGQRCRCSHRWVGSRPCLPRSRLFLAERHDRDFENGSARGDPDRGVGGLREPDVRGGSAVGVTECHHCGGQARGRRRDRAVVDDGRRDELGCPAAFHDGDVGLRRPPTFSGPARSTRRHRRRSGCPWWLTAGNFPAGRRRTVR